MYLVDKKEKVKYFVMDKSDERYIKELIHLTRNYSKFVYYNYVRLIQYSENNKYIIGLLDYSPLDTKIIDALKYPIVITYDNDNTNVEYDSDSYVSYRYYNNLKLFNLHKNKSYIID